MNNNGLQDYVKYSHALMVDGNKEWVFDKSLSNNYQTIQAAAAAANSHVESTEVKQSSACSVLKWVNTQEEQELQATWDLCARLSKA